MSRVCAAAQVDMSTRTLSAPPVDATPSSPKMTFSSAAPSLTQVMTNTLSRAGSAGLRASVAPAFSSSVSFALSRFQMTGAKPHSIRRRMMAPPSTPAPMQPTRGFSLFIFILLETDS